MDVAQDLGASMPAWLLYPVTLMVILMLIYPFYRARSVIGGFALFALCFRYIANAHHAITFKASPLGLSWNALGSSAVFLVGLLLIKKRHLLLKQMMPVYCFIAVIVVSGMANHDVHGIVDVVVKYGYLGLITIVVYEGLDDLGENRMAVLLLWAFVMPFVLQALSVIFGVIKASESDGSVSYIGGYNHEAAFSIVLMTCFVIACFTTGIRPILRGAILCICLVGILLANYRTAILALAPLAIIQFNMDVIGRFPRQQRSIVAVGVLLISLPAFLAVAWLLRDRFQDISVALSSLDDLIKRPAEYSYEESRLLSGRPYIWSSYISAYMDGGTLNHLVGFGPDAWIGVFVAYAHNTLVSALYEYGIFGVCALLYLWGAMLYTALRVKHGPRGKLVAAHVSFFLLNMATMPQWMLEGDIRYGVICGYTLYFYLRPVPTTVTAQPMPTITPVPEMRTSRGMLAIDRKR
ncbi:MAG: O-antigen ligase family protein [Rhodospirillaceae bacterium]|nr:O-antigen ligase family protein [Rhodospirillaceae bacterium]